MDEEIYNQIAYHYERVKELELLRNEIKYSSDVDFIIKARTFGFGNKIKTKLKTDSKIMENILDALIIREQKDLNNAIDKIINNAIDKKLIEEYKNEYKNRR